MLWYPQSSLFRLFDIFSNIRTLIPSVGYYPLSGVIILKTYQ